MSAPIDRPNNYGQAGETFRQFEDWERDELIENLSEALAACDSIIQEAMVDHFTQADEEYGRLVQEGVKQKMEEIKETMAEHNVPGRDSGNSKFGQGTPEAKEATEEAVDKGHEADPY